MNALQIQGLTKEYPGFTLDRLDLTLPNGCIMGLIGENGAGKSTLIKLILNMIPRDSGDIRIWGQENCTHIHELKDDIGVVLDEVGIHSCLNAIEMGKVLRLAYKKWDDGLYSQLLRDLDIPTSKKFGAYSRGMKMKLGIATALSHHPKLLLLDEATSGLDPLVRDEITDLFYAFTQDENHAVLISSHIVSDLEKICDYVAFLHKGKLLLSDEKDRLKDQYAVIHCTAEVLESIPSFAILGKKENSYGAEAVVAREAVPRNMDFGPVDLETLFIYTAKGKEKQ